MENAVFVTISIIGASLVLVDVYLKKTTLPVIIFYLIIGLIVGLIIGHIIGLELWWLPAASAKMQSTAASKIAACSPSVGQ